MMLIVWNVCVKSYERYFITSEPDNKNERENDKQLVEPCYIVIQMKQNWISTVEIARFLFPMIKP